jgi:basic membrane lipoprotein Med (substrate-binding protein (PBP1-ABC) superfamily)
MHNCRPSRRKFLQVVGAAATATALTPHAFAQSKVRVAGVYSVPVDQQWVSRIHIALKAAEARGEIQYVWSENVPFPDMDRTARDWAQKGVQLITGEVYSYEVGIRKIAAQSPKTAFLSGSGKKPQAPNLSVFDDHIDEASYLAGMVAGGMTKTNVIGMISAYPIPTKNRLLNAFHQGALYVNPKVTVMVNFIGSWFDPPKAKEAAFAQMDQGADIFYAERDGVADAAKERGKLSIGNLVNTQAQFPETVVTCALWHMEPTINAVLEQVKAGRFVATDYSEAMTLKNGGASLAPFGTFENRVPAELKTKIKQREAEFKQGAFKLNIDASEPKSTRS